MNEQEFFEKFVDYCLTSALYGERNSNGADSYNCPSCGAYVYIKGYCSNVSGISDVTHSDDCDLMNMYRFAQQRLEHSNE